MTGSLNSRGHRSSGDATRHSCACCCTDSFFVRRTGVTLPWGNLRLPCMFRFFLCHLLCLLALSLLVLLCDEFCLLLIKDYTYWAPIIGKLVIWMCRAPLGAQLTQALVHFWQVFLYFNAQLLFAQKPSWVTFASVSQPGWVGSSCNHFCTLCENFFTLRHQLKHLFALLQAHLQSMFLLLNGEQRFFCRVALCRSGFTFTDDRCPCCLKVASLLLGKV
mmetsp:Transcript_18042/g.41469  ORF Transcript_18042/g.41469 Transcript_18042/m.41469 type:complete len:219 (+) Transcript_18042:791-1447(+)